jgi:hypothetical protein
VTTRYRFIMTTDDCEDATVELSFTPAGAAHFEVTDFYLRFLRACGFFIKNANDPDVNELSYENNITPR